ACRLFSRHVALAVEEAAGVDQQAGSVNVAEHDAMFLNLQAFRGVNRAFDLTGNTHHFAKDVTLDFSLVVDHQGALRADLTLEVRVDANQAGGDLHLAFHFHAGFEPADPVVGQVG